MTRLEFELYLKKKIPVFYKSIENTIVGWAKAGKHPGFKEEMTPKQTAWALAALFMCKMSGREAVSKWINRMEDFWEGEEVWHHPVIALTQFLSDKELAKQIELIGFDFSIGVMLYKTKGMEKSRIAPSRTIEKVNWDEYYKGIRLTLNVPASFIVDLAEMIEVSEKVITEDEEAHV